MTQKITVPGIKAMKAGDEKITMLTAYHPPFARILDEAGVDILLVGDSVGSVVAGYSNTLPVTIEEMIYHTRAVAKGVTRALVVIDMPFMSYQISNEEAKRNAGRMIKESGAEAVKLEGGMKMKGVIKAIADIDIPVMGHIGLTPQSIHQMGGHKVQGQVIHDVLGLMGNFRPKFVKSYVDLRAVISQAVENYMDEVRKGKFPTKEHSFHL